MATNVKERGLVVPEGAGGFLNPPGHPEHTHSVQTDLRRRRENRGSMSLSYAASCEWLDERTRADAGRMLALWKPLPLAAPEVVAWVRQVLGYFRGCYRGPGADPECWNAGNLRIVSDPWRMQPVDDHAGVHLIRRYYPHFAPTAEDFANAKWGK